MKTISHTKPGSENMLHIETPLGIVNITVGLRDCKGRRVDSIEVIPDSVEMWGKRIRRSGYGNTRLIELKGKGDRKEVNLKGKYQNV
jgi:hypothetical protein